jgi:hypothetical protein
VFYGAAEFSRDCDIVISSDESNLNRLTAALAALHAECTPVSLEAPVSTVKFLSNS